MDSFDLMVGGELYVPRIPSMKVVDLAEAVAPGAPTHEIGIRPGEKLHEEMIAADDSRRTLRLGDRYVVMPTIATWGYTPPEPGATVPDGFSYTSDTNDLWLSVDGDPRHDRTSELMAIPYGRQSISDADIEAVCDALRSDWLTTGPRVRGFEEAIARPHGDSRGERDFWDCGAARRVRRRRDRPGRRGDHHADDLRGHGRNRSPARGDGGLRRH